MNKSILVGTAVVLAAIALGLYFFTSENGHKDVVVQESKPQDNEGDFDAKNSTFTVENEPVTLVDGLAEQPIAGSSAKITTRYFGNDARGDLNGDGREDYAFLITQNSGGSGTFYYAVVALRTPEGYNTTNAFFVGDRIAPQSTEIHSDSMELHINYATRKDGEPMTAEPSQGKVLLLKVTKEGILEGLMQ